MRGLAKGWAPTFIGYSMQGLCKFGFYEVFKILYGDMLGEVSKLSSFYLGTFLFVQYNITTHIFTSSVMWLCKLSSSIYKPLKSYAKLVEIYGNSLV